MERTGIRDVAREAGVSITTVSKVLNHYTDVSETTRRRVEEVIARLHYMPDEAGRRMGGADEPVIGLLLSDLRPTDPSGAVYGILSGLCRACTDRGIDFVLLTTDPERQKSRPLAALCASKRLAGLVCAGFRRSDAYLAQLPDLGVPCAFIDMAAGCPGVLNITVDNERAAAEAVDFLLRGGRRRIALMNGSPEADVSVLRGRGWRRALQAAGLPPAPELELEGDFSEERAHVLALGLLRADPGVDAFFCASDVMALGVCRAAEELGRQVGGDLYVVGFDDIPVARCVYGGLTTVRQNFYGMGYAAGEAVRARIAGEEPAPGCGSMLYELVVRGSAPAGA